VDRLGRLGWSPRTALASRIIRRAPETAISGARSLYCATGSFSTVGTGKRGKRPSQPDIYGPNRPGGEPSRDHDVIEMTTKTTTDEDGRVGPPGSTITAARRTGLNLQGAPSPVGSSGLLGREPGGGARSAGLRRHGPGGRRRHHVSVRPRTPLPRPRPRHRRGQPKPRSCSARTTRG
jgi:hypothetical protein